VADFGHGRFYCWLEEKPYNIQQYVVACYLKPFTEKLFRGNPDVNALAFIQRVARNDEIGRSSANVNRRDF
jgi:hypothetical protein